MQRFYDKYIIKMEIRQKNESVMSVKQYTEIPFFFDSIDFQII